MNNKKKVIEIIKKIIVENDIEFSVEEINDSTLLTNDLGLDSLDLALLTVEIESEFGVDIFENGLISTVGEIFEQLK
ncbi:acyl carrier protein [Candidatus Woesearchaeota archaeon]|jgi:acyl carrier protein|nr:acyl carrier protein [Candidatus Woesearchaeota archaeon]